jgi:hypothetical protein
VRTQELAFEFIARLDALQPAVVKIVGHRVHVWGETGVNPIADFVEEP